MPGRLILASTSPYRRTLLERLGLPFEVAAPKCDETPLSGEAPQDTASRLAVLKAKSLQIPDALIIGSDQVADLNGVPVGKPESQDGARRQLRAMRGQVLVFHSGVALVNADTGNTQSAIIPTTVRFRQYSDAEIEHYLQCEDALDCAGSAKSEGLGIALIASMQSEDPTALVGLPLIELSTMLRNEGMGVLE